MSDAVGKGFTVMAAVDNKLVPPGPVQVREYDALLERAPVLCVPLDASVPFQLPEALHEVA